MSDTITVNLSSYPEDITVNLTTESSGVTANIVETTLTFLEGAGLYRENVFTENNTFEQDVNVQGDLTVDGTTVIPHISGNTALSGNLSITGNNDITGNLSVTGSVSVDNVTFDQTPELAGGVGVMRWNDTDGTLDLGLKGGNVTLQLGQEFVVRVVNKTNADLLESQYKVVRIRTVAEGGAQGQRLAVVLAEADNDLDSVTTLGVVTENIDNNQEGFITTMGQVKQINTTGSLQGETWEDGDVLYLSPTTAGALTKVKPQAPQHTVTIGYVEYAHQINGKIFVKIDNGYELDELHNVRITNPQNAQVLTYNSLSGLWVNANGTGGGTGNYLPLSGGTLTGPLVINSTLSATATGELAHNLTGNINLIGTESQQLNASYANTISLSGQEGVTISTASNRTITLNAEDIVLNGEVSGVTNLIVSNSITGNSISTNTATFSNANATEYDVTGTVGGGVVASKSVAGWAFLNKATPALTSDTSPQAVYFKPDGSVMYILGSNAAATYRVYAHNVPTPWDVSTVSAAATLSSVLIDPAMQGLYFSPDGRYFFTLTQNRTVKRFQMPIGSEWNVSTGVLSGSFTLGATQTVNRGITFKPDGTKMYVYDDNTNFVYEYNLSPAWDLTAPSLATSALLRDAVSDITISSDGTRLIATGTDTVIYEYTLPTPWSVTGIFFKARMYRGTGSTGFPNGGPAVIETGLTGIYYNDVLNKCFFVGSSVDRVQEIDATPQPAIVGTRPIILSNVANSVADRVTMNSLYITDTTQTISGTTGALLVAGGIGAGGAVNTPILNAANVQATGTDSGIITLQFRGSIRTAGSGNNGFIRLGNEAGTDFDRLIFGQFTASYPAIRRNQTVGAVGLEVITATNTGYADLKAKDITATGPVTFPSTTVAGLTAFSAATYTGGMVFVSNESGGATMAFSDGTNWRRVRDNAIVT